MRIRDIVDFGANPSDLDLEALYNAPTIDGAALRDVFPSFAVYLGYMSSMYAHPTPAIDFSAKRRERRIAPVLDFSRKERRQTCR
jgi:hypothetical protein